MQYIITFFLAFLLIPNIHAVEHEVKMLNQGSSGVMVFEPAVLKINIGDSVTFKATDAAHNSASVSSMIPEGGSTWNSSLSRDITVKFDKSGIYVYQCTPHVMMAMVGVIQVGEDKSNLEKVKENAALFKSSFVMNNTRLDDYLSEL